MNSITLIGYMGTDPVSRQTQSNTKVTSFSFAQRSKKNGEEIVTWYKIVIWGDRFDKMLQYLKKGTGLIIIGELMKPEVYTDKQGKQQINLEVTANSLNFIPFVVEQKKDEKEARQRQKENVDEEIPF